MTNEVTTQEPAQEQDMDAKNTIFYNPIFPIMTASVNLDLPIEEMANGIAQLSSDTKNYEGGYTTYFNNQNIEHIPGIKELREAIYGITCAFARELKQEFNEEKMAIRLWANYMRRGGYHPPHIHTQSQYSGTFYVMINDKAAPFVFCNPTEPFRMHEPPVIRQEDYTPFTSPTCMMRPKPNQLYLWPSWMSHFVPEHQDDAPRISISFNVDTLPRGA